MQAQRGRKTRGGDTQGGHAGGTRRGDTQGGHPGGHPGGTRRDREVEVQQVN